MIFIPALFIIVQTQFYTKPCFSPQCKTCDQRQYGCIDCINGFYYDKKDGICYACHFSCQSCSQKSQSKCTSCDFQSKRYMTNNGKCLCQVQYYEAGQKECKKCQQGCIECKAQNQCSKCDINKFYKETPEQDRCICDTEYTKVSATNNTCVQCQKPCKTCFGPNVTSCISCIDNYYINESNSTCSLCPGQCWICDGANLCKSCKTQRGYYLQSGKCVCQLRYYQKQGFMGVVQNRTSCAPCHPHCLSCSGSLSNNCIECSQQDNREFSSNQCICIKGYFQDQDHCINCPQQCTNCTNFTTCGGCIQKYFLNTTSSYCQQCDYTCETCDGSANTSCLSCDKKQYRVFDTNQCKCQKGYYSNLTLCSLCPQNCLQCNNDTHCTECTQYYFVNTNNMCQRCHISCRTCRNQSDTGCTTCFLTQNRYLDSGQKCLCLKSYYQQQMQCFKCHFSCSQCTNKQYNNCSVCDLFHHRVLENNSCLCMTGYYDNNTVTCQKCNYTCVSCKDFNQCLTCTQLNFRQIDLGTLKCNCKDSYYEDSVPTCSKCKQQCTKCNNSTVCTQCIDNYYLINNSCAQCHYKCLTCETNETNCLTCPNITQNNRIKNQNDCLCNSSYYDAGVTKCYRCHFSCVTCSITGINCTKCSDGQLSNANGNRCPFCAIECKKCEVSVNNCTQCTDKSMILNNGNCSCPVNYFFDQEGICQQCHITCSSCSGLQKNLCTDCNQNTTKRIASSTSAPFRCECDFVNGFYDEDTQRQCKKCSSSCKTCRHLETICYSCFDFTYLLSYRCLQECPIKFYPDNSDNTCKKCIIYCDRCINGVQCLKCSAGRFSHISTCVDSCPFPFKVATGNVCQNCTTKGQFLYQANCATKCQDDQQAIGQNYECTSCQQQCKSLTYKIGGFYQQVQVLFINIHFNRKIDPNFQKQDWLIFGRNIETNVTKLVIFQKQIILAIDINQNFQKNTIFIKTLSLDKVVSSQGNALSTNLENVTLTKVKSIHPEDINVTNSLCIVSRLTVLGLLLIVLFGSFFVPSKLFTFMLYLPATMYFFAFVQESLSNRSRQYFRCFDSMYLQIIPNFIMQFAPPYYIQKAGYQYYLTTHDANFLRLAGSSIIIFFILLIIYFILKYLLLESYPFLKRITDPIKLIFKFLLINILLSAISSFRYIKDNIDLFQGDKLLFFYISFILSFVGLLLWIINFIVKVIQDSKKHSTYIESKRIKQYGQIFFRNSYMVWLILISQYKKLLFGAPIINMLFLYTVRLKLDFAVFLHCTINTIISFLIIFQQQSQQAITIIMIVLVQLGLFANMIFSFYVIVTNSIIYGFEDLNQEESDLQWNQELGKFVKKGGEDQEERKFQIRRKRVDVAEILNDVDNVKEREIKRKQYKNKLQLKFQQ